MGIRTGWVWEVDQLRSWMAETGRPVQTHAIRVDEGLTPLPSSSAYLSGYVACTLRGPISETVYVGATTGRVGEAPWLCPNCLRVTQDYPFAHDAPVPIRS